MTTSAPVVLGLPPGLPWPLRNWRWLTVPLHYSEKTLGALTVLIAATTPLSEDRIGLLRTLAHVASATIESHRLRTREATAFREVDRAVRSDLSVRQQLERLLDQMVGACDAQSGTIFRWDAPGAAAERVVHRPTRGFPQDTTWEPPAIWRHCAARVVTTGAASRGARRTPSGE